MKEINEAKKITFIINWVSNKLCNKYLHQLHEMTFNWQMNKWYDLSVIRDAVIYVLAEFVR